MMQVSAYIRHILTVQWHFTGELFTLGFMFPTVLLRLQNIEAH